MERASNPRRLTGVAPLFVAAACTFGGSVNGSGTDGTSAAASTTDVTSGPDDGADPAGPDDGPSTTDPDDTGTRPGTTGPDTTESSGDTTGTQRQGELLGQDRLAVQYFLDEIARGGKEGMLLDSASEPKMHLVVDYSTSARQPFEIGNEGQRGLEWTDPESRGGAWLEIGEESKIGALDGEPAVSFELVLEVTDVHNQLTPWGRVFAWQRDFQTEGMQFGVLTAPYDDGFAIDVRSEFEQDIQPLARLPLAAFPGRIVLHVVFDSTAAELDRLRMYVDGVREEPLFVNTIEAERTLTANPDTFLVLGNRPENNASFAGRLYYAAIYAAALSDDIIANNATVLALHDDP